MQIMEQKRKQGAHSHKSQGARSDTTESYKYYAQKTESPHFEGTMGRRTLRDFVC
jgi:hypothetical protein